MMIGNKPPDGVNFELSSDIVENGASKSIAVAANALATDTWRDMVDATQTDYCERGLVVGRHGHAGELIRSKPLKGYCELQDEGGPEVLPASLAVPIFPFGIIKGMSPRTKEDVLVHTHPMPPALDHLRTTMISDQDIRLFTGSRFKAMVVLDRGGAHLLARTSRFPFQAGVLNTPNLVTDTICEVLEESGGSMDVMMKVAHGLARHGLGYYYTPELSQTDSTVEFKNLRDVD